MAIIIHNDDVDNHHKASLLSIVLQLVLLVTDHQTKMLHSTLLICKPTNLVWAPRLLVTTGTQTSHHPCDSRFIMSKHRQYNSDNNLPYHIIPSSPSFPMHHHQPSTMYPTWLCIRTQYLATFTMRDWINHLGEHQTGPPSYTHIYPTSGLSYRFRATSPPSNQPSFVITHRGLDPN